MFDAKYRIGSDRDYLQRHKTYGPKEDDINTMHRYRDAIVYNVDPDKTKNKENLGPFERLMFGAYVLFPYSDQEEYKKHEFYKSIEAVNIGGLPFLPSATKLVKDFLERLITDTAESAFERATLPRGIEEKLTKVDWSRRDVLIVKVTDQASMDEYRADLCCRVPRAVIAREHLPILYVALYQPAVGIEYVGTVLVVKEEVRCVAVADTLSGDASKDMAGEAAVKGVQDAALKGESESEKTGKAAEYVFKVDNWRKLEHTIGVQEFGVASVAYTNLFLLEHSTAYSELHLKSEAEYRFYSELKRRVEGVQFSKENVSGFEFEGKKVVFANGQITVRNGKDVVGPPVMIAEFERTPNAVFRRVMGYLERISADG